MKRGIVTEFEAGSVLATLKAHIESEGKYRKLNIKQILAIANKKPSELNQTLVSTEGLVFKEKEESDSFVLVRFLITCCAADATPLGIRVISEKVKDLKQDIWVKVKGKVIIENEK